MKKKHRESAVFDTHLVATLTISSEKDSKYASVSLN